jgi:integrase/recombinase XerD
MKRKTHDTGYKTGEIAFTKKEVDKLLSVCNTLEDEVFIRLMIAVGLRREDAAHVEVANIDLVDGQLTFYEKKKDLTRSVPIPPSLIKVIKQYLQTIPKSQKFLFKCGKSEYGGRTLYNKLQNLCELAGIPNRPVHALRSSCAKLHLMEGWQISHVASLLGDLPSTIENYYVCPSNAEIRELMARSEIV